MLPRNGGFGNLPARAPVLFPLSVLSWCCPLGEPVRSLTLTLCNECNLCAESFCFGRVCPEMVQIRSG
jgi:hypothetical protein